MIIFLNLDGTANVVTPERIFQGSSVNTVDAISAYPNATSMQVAFFLPNGTTTEYAPMYLMSVSSEERVGVWSYTMPFSVTEKQGKVGVSIMATLSNGKQTSYTCDFSVEESVLPTPPPMPTVEVYDLILQYLARQQAELVNLDIRVTDIENITVKRTMIDLTAEVSGAEATFTKFYSDSTTAAFTMPLVGGGAVSASGLVVNTFTAESWRDIGTMEEPSGIYELAFAGSQVGQSDSDFIASVAKVDSFAYEVGAETSPTVKNGYTILSDKIFKGSDGSVLLTGVRSPYAGQLICYNGKINGQENLIVDILVSENGRTLTITFFDGSTKTLDLTVTTEKIAEKAVTFDKCSEQVQNLLLSGGSGNSGIAIDFGANDWNGENAPFAISIPKADYAQFASGWIIQFSGNLIFGIERSSLGITLTSTVKKPFTIYIK